MAVDNILRTYGDVSRVEDVVLNAIEILTAKETQIFNMLGKTSARDTVHSYLTDTLATPASSAVGEGEDYTSKALSTPSRLVNIIQNNAITFKVTRTQRLVEHYHGQDELARQTSKAMMEWANSAELDLLKSTLVSGASGTVVKMSGICEAISKSTNFTAHTSGTVFSATILDGLMKANFENSNGDVATDLFVCSGIRATIDGFTQKTNVVVNNPNGMTTIVRNTTTYETSFGTLKVHTHRYMRKNVSYSDEATDRVLALNPEKLKIAFLEKPRIDNDLARSGDYEVRAIVGKFTLETHNQDSNFQANGFLKS